MPCIVNYDKMNHCLTVLCQGILFVANMACHFINFVKNANGSIVRDSCTVVDTRVCDLIKRPAMSNTSRRQHKK